MDQRLLGILIDSFPKILLPGLTMTIPLTVISFSLALVIAVITAMVQFAGVKVFKQIARFYIWVVRGTPLLVQLYVIFYGLPNLGIMLEPFPSAVLVLPPMGNEIITLVKDTSLAANITVMEMFMVTQRIASRYYEHLALYIEVALIYLLFCTVLTKLQSIGEKKLNSYGAV